MKLFGKGAIFISFDDINDVFDPQITSECIGNTDTEKFHYYSEVNVKDNMKYRNVIQFIEEYNPEYQFIGVCEIRGAILKDKAITKAIIAQRNLQEEIVVFKEECFTCEKNMEREPSFPCPDCHKICYCSKQCMVQDIKKGHNILHKWLLK